MTEDDKSAGLYQKYEVSHLDDAEGKHEGCRYFVLDPQHDPLARYALIQYADIARIGGQQALYEDIMDWVNEIDGSKSGW